MYDSVYLRTRFRTGLNYELRNTIGGWDRDTSTWQLLRDAALRAESLREEFTGKRQCNVPAASSSSSPAARDNWRSKGTSPTASTKSVDPNAMVVDAATFVCFNCYRENHKASECMYPKEPYRQVIRKGIPQTKRVAATSTAASPSPAKVAATSTSEPGAGDASRIAELEDQLKEMHLKMGRFMEMMAQPSPPEKDFQ
jgi:hypothetical protein